MLIRQSQSYLDDATVLHVLLDYVVFVFLR